MTVELTKEEIEEIMSWWNCVENERYLPQDTFEKELKDKLTKLLEDGI